MAQLETGATPATIGKVRALNAQQRAALAQYGPADIEGVNQFIESLSQPGEAKKGSDVVKVTAARVRQYFKGASNAK
jgi:hypothetical protein